MRLAASLLSLLFVLALPFAASSQVPRLLPAPAALERRTGSFTLGPHSGIAVPPADRGAAVAAGALSDALAADKGLRIGLNPAGRIRFERDRSIQGAEAYRVTVDASGIRIQAATDAGLYYGAMTLTQLAAVERGSGGAVVIPALRIEDQPAYPWRGLMLDVARHFLPIAEVTKIVDQMAAVKLNVLHLHLTDDQGWRFEVKRYPLLTRIGAWRTPPSAGGAPAAKVGGFYTQAQLRALVEHAARRNVTIVPEIDLPGHAQALVAAYPQFGVFGDRPQVSHDWGINPYLLDPGPESVAFVEQVLDELMAVFPGTYIHLGGDEAIKDQWQRSPRVQARIKLLGLEDENALQSWMIDRFGDYLAKHGRRLIGWDEILEGGLPASASVMSWRGDRGALEAAQQNHDVVLAPAPTLYLDSLQSDHADEPPGRLSIQTLADVYKYDPMPAGLDATKAKHVLGAEVTAFSEYLVTPFQVEHVIFPRAAALADTIWTGGTHRDFQDFLSRLDPQIARWRHAGVEVADSAFAVAFSTEEMSGDALRRGRVKLALSTQSHWGTIHYTTDGRVPTATSPAYNAVLTIPLGVTVKAVAVRPDGTATAAARSFDTSRSALLTRTGSDLVACPKGALGLRVPLTSEAAANRPVFNVNLFDTCTMYRAAPLALAAGFVVDVARLPRHYGLAHEADKVREHYNVTRYGELLLIAGCTDGAAKQAVVGSFPLPDPAKSPNRFAFQGQLPKIDGDRDLCLQFTAPIAGPFYAIERIRLTEGGR